LLFLAINADAKSPHAELEARVEALEAQNVDQQDQINELYDRLESLEAYRFIDMCDGTILDNNTGLIWLRDASVLVLIIHQKSILQTIWINQMTPQPLAWSVR